MDSLRALALRVVTHDEVQHDIERIAGAARGARAAARAGIAAGARAAARAGIAAGARTAASAQVHATGAARSDSEEHGRSTDAFVAIPAGAAFVHVDSQCRVPAPHRNRPSPADRCTVGRWTVPIRASAAERQQLTSPAMREWRNWQTHRF
ncbi:MAG: hypothetical protein FJ301_04825 [Planctomycetes bacterium]|nr:hypothetical protein [Planctomycetota bacterium]